MGGSSRQYRSSRAGILFTNTYSSNGTNAAGARELVCCVKSVSTEFLIFENSRVYVGTSKKRNIHESEVSFLTAFSGPHD